MSLKKVKHFTPAMLTSPLGTLQVYSRELAVNNSKQTNNLDKDAYCIWVLYNGSLKPLKN